MTLDRLLGDPALARVVDRLVERLRRGLPLRGSLVLASPSDAEREAVDARLGRRPSRGADLTLDLDRLESIVVATGAATSLADAVVQLRGPVITRADVVAAERAVWDGVFAGLAAGVAQRPDLVAWPDRLRGSGLVARLCVVPADADRVLRDVAAVLTNLPAQAEPLATFAARVLGSAHGLDRTTAASTVVLHALRFLHGSASGPAGTAPERRALWAEEGVVLDSLSSTVLVHRVPLPGALGEVSASGEPVVLTLRQVWSLDLTAPAHPVFVCENPSVVEAAAAAGSRAALVCVAGRPSAAAGRLLTAVAPAGLRYHGDFDWGGVQIGNALHTRFGFEPWRFGAGDLAGTPPGAPLAGAPVDALWDVRLRSALEARGSRLEEEQVVDRLIGDLVDSAV